MYTTKKITDHISVQAPFTSVCFLVGGLAANYSFTRFFNSTRSGALCTIAGAIFPSLLNDWSAVTGSSHLHESGGRTERNFADSFLKIFSVSRDCVIPCVSLILFSMNSLLLANLTKNPEEARKPVSLHSGVTKDILLCNLNCLFGFCNLSFNCTNWEFQSE